MLNHTRRKLGPRGSLFLTSGVAMFVIACLMFGIMVISGEPVLGSLIATAIIVLMCYALAAISAYKDEGPHGMLPKAKYLAGKLVRFIAQLLLTSKLQHILQNLGVINNRGKLDSGVIIEHRSKDERLAILYALRSGNAKLFVDAVNRPRNTVRH